MVREINGLPPTVQLPKCALVGNWADIPPVFDSATNEDSGVAWSSESVMLPARSPSGLLT